MLPVTLRDFGTHFHWNNLRGSAEHDTRLKKARRSAAGLQTKTPTVYTGETSIEISIEWDETVGRCRALVVTSKSTHVVLRLYLGQLVGWLVDVTIQKPC